MNTRYLFYDVMQYPIPFQKEFFAYEEVLSTVKKPGDVQFSRGKRSPYIEDFVEHVNMFQWLWRGLPFVDAIYIGNSLSFNALHDGSDIDLFIIVSPGRMWLARLCSNTALFVMGLKRRRGFTHKKFCLSFYAERDALNLQSIKLPHADPYLVYWLAHLVNIYQRLPQQPIDIYEQNYRLREYLPNFPMEHVISLGTKVFTGNTSFKVGVERLLGGRIGSGVEWLIKVIWIPILLIKKKRLGPLGESIIISDHMLKFHADKRLEYAMKWKIAAKSDK